MAGFTITLDGGGKTSKLPALYANLKDRDSLNLSDLSPTGRVTTSQIEVMDRVSYSQHEIHIDKSALSGNSYLEKNANGSLKAVNLDTGATNLISISSVNYTQHASYFSISAGRYLRITSFEKLAAPATYRIVIQENSGTSTLLQFVTSAGSVELNS